MRTENDSIAIKELVENFTDKEDEGVTAYNGNLIVRPRYQREFVYDEKQQIAVIETIMDDLYLGVMHWSPNPAGWELIDGQQRTISICRFINNRFIVRGNYFKNYPADIKNKILNYRIDLCKFFGTESEKLRWFKTVNMQGAKLTDQELLNAVYAGDWLESAKVDFSKPSNVALSDDYGKGYVKGNSIRQEILEKVLEWAANKEGFKDIETYMANHQSDKNANELWNYYEEVIKWAKTLFPKPIKGITDVQDWGILYNKYSGKTYDPKAFADEISELNLDDDVTKKSGIIPWLLSERRPSDERFLSLRSFSEAQKRKAFTRQEGVCPICQNKFEFDEMEGDHIIPWSRGGRTVDENLQMLCKNCNSAKSGK